MGRAARAAESHTRGRHGVPLTVHKEFLSSSKKKKTCKDRRRNVNLVGFNDNVENIENDMIENNDNNERGNLIENEKNKSDSDNESVTSNENITLIPELRRSKRVKE